MADPRYKKEEGGNS